MSNTDLVPSNINQEAVLATLGINPSEPASQALLLICQKYDLDPLLRHVQLLPTKAKDANGNWKTKHEPYITRDGYLHIAHASGVFNGLEILEETETNATVTVKVAVWRRDMSRPFTATGRAKKNDERSKADPYDMALTRAERRALRRAFNVGGVVEHADDWDEIPELYNAETGEISAPPETPAPAEQPAFQEPPLPNEIESSGPGVTPMAPELARPVGGDGAESKRKTEQPQPANDKPTESQIESIQQLLRALDILGPTRYTTVSAIIDRTVQSGAELSATEASTVIAYLQDEVTKKETAGL